LRLGGDVRFQGYLYADKEPDTTSTRYGFFMMQADLDAHWQLGNDLSVTVAHDALRGAPEVYGMVTFHETLGYVRAGSFLPNYGVKVDDHTAFIRGGSTRLPLSDGLFWRPKYVDTGLEVGYKAGPSWTVGVYNGNDRNPLGPDTVAPVAANEKALLARGESYFQVGSAVALLGANGYTNWNADLEDRTLLGGAFGGVSLGELTLMAEGDYVKNYLLSAADETKGAKSLAAYVEGAYRIRRGIHLIGRFEHFDPDLDVQSGKVMRVSLGAEVFPVASMEIKPTFRYQTDSRTLPDKTDAPDTMEVLLQTHWWF
jgi:hypothetical protein